MAKRELFIPETPQELTPQWLSTVLAENNHTTPDAVVGASQTMLGEGEGFVGDIIRLDLTYTDGAHGPETVIAKMPKLANRAMGEMLGAYERENMFYMTLGDALPVATPKLYYGEFDRDAASENQEEILRQLARIPEFLQGVVGRLGKWIAGSKKRRYILLMEDVSNAEPCDQVAGADRDTYRKILTATARLHAHFWESNQLENKFWLLPLDVDAPMRFSMLQRSREAFARAFSQQLSAGLAPYVQDVARNGMEYCVALNNSPTTLAHCDLRLDNLFFRDGEVLFIDWQLVRRGAPAYDLAYLLSCGLNDTDSADDLLTHYHQALTDAGVSEYPLADLQRDYRCALKVVLMNLSSVDQMELGTGRGAELLQRWITRLHQRLAADTEAVI